MFGQSSLAALIEEFTSVRKATLSLFRGLDEAAWTRQGVANKNEVTVRAIAYIIAGHELHHRRIFLENVFPPTLPESDCSMLSDSAILKKIERQPKRTAGFKQMVRELGVRGDARRELSERLQQLVASGQLQQVDSDRYAIPQAAAGKNLAVGRLSMHRDGFGFVIPEPTSLDERLKTRLAGDVFIPPPAVGSAMHGDRVLVEIVNIRPDGRAEGRIVRLIGQGSLDCSRESFTTAAVLQRRHSD